MTMPDEPKPSWSVSYDADMLVDSYILRAPSHKGKTEVFLMEGCLPWFRQPLNIRCFAKHSWLNVDGVPRGAQLSKQNLSFAIWRWLRKTRDGYQEEGHWEESAIVVILSAGFRHSDLKGSCCHTACKPYVFWEHLFSIIKKKIL